MEPSRSFKALDERMESIHETSIPLTMAGKGPRTRLSNRGQASSGELVIAYFIFVVVLVLAMSFWANSTQKIEKSEDLNDFEDTAIEVAEKLIRTRGVPTNWTKNDVTVISLTDTPRNINNGKLIAFIQMMNHTGTDNDCAGLMNYDCYKHLLGAGKYDFYFRLEDIDGNLRVVNGINCSTGKEPTEDDEMITVYRTAMLEGNITRVRLTLWYNETLSI